MEDDVRVRLSAGMPGLPRWEEIGDGLPRE